MQAAVEVRVTDGGAEAAAAVEQGRWKRIGFVQVGKLRAHAQRTDHLATAEQIDVPVEVATRFMAWTNGVSSPASLTLRTESILYRCVHLPLQLQKIRHVEVLGLEPAQKHIVILARASEMDMVVGGDPILGCAAGPVFQLQRDAAGFPGPQVELLGRRHVEQSTIGFHAVMALRKIEGSMAF